MVLSIWDNCHADVGLSVACAVPEVQLNVARE